MAFPELGNTGCLDETVTISLGSMEEREEEDYTSSVTICLRLADN